MSTDKSLPPQTIAVVSAGATEFTRKIYITDLEGFDISADTVKLSVGSEDAPGTWSVLTIPGSAQITVEKYISIGGRNPFRLPLTQILYRRSAQLLIGAGGGSAVNPGVGSYWLWLQLGDGAETVPRRAFKLIVT